MLSKHCLPTVPFFVGETDVGSGDGILEEKKMPADECLLLGKEVAKCS